MRPPGRGDFWILKIAHAPSPKNLSKNGLPQKGGSLSGEGIFAKKISECGSEIAPEPQRGNPMSPLPRVAIIYWIGGLPPGATSGDCRSDGS